MWVFDGEEWTEEGGSSSGATKNETTRPRYDELTPELQVIEILPVPQTNRVPVVPFTIP